MNAWLRKLAIPATVVAALSLASGTTAKAGQFDRLKERGGITLCADRDFLPHSSDKMDPPGFDVEVAQAVAAELGLKLNYKWVVTRKGYRALRNLYRDECDFFMGLPDDENFLDEAFRIAVTEPYYNGGFAVLIRKDAKSKKLEDYKSEGVGVQMITVPDFRLFDDGYERKIYKSISEMLPDFKSGKLNVAVVPTTEAAWIAKTQPELGLTVLPQTQKRFIYKMGFGVLKKEPTMKAALDPVVKKLKKDGVIKKLMAKYGIPEMVAEGEAGSTTQPAPSQSEPQNKSESAPASEGDDDDEVDKAQLEEDFPSDAANLDMGRKLYKQACYKCHGNKGRAGGTRPDVRKFVGDQYDMYGVVFNGRLDYGMPAFAEYLTETEIKQIVVYIWSLPKPEDDN